MLKYLIIIMAGLINYSYATEEQFDDIMKKEQFTAGGRNYSICINKKFFNKLSDKSNQEQLLKEIQSIKNNPPMNVDWLGFYFRFHDGKWESEPIGNYLKGY